MKYRKKPIIVDAWQFKPEDHDDLEEINEHGVYKDSIGSKTGWLVDTLEGNHEVTPNDWIITGVKGEHYPVKPDIFEMTYEKA